MPERVGWLAQERVGWSAHGRACNSMVHPSSRRRSLRAMASMAAVATSAALPWMGVLMAARSAWPCAAALRQQVYGHVSCRSRTPTRDAREAKKHVSPHLEFYSPDDHSLNGP